jgi:F0F1-type ATP synthase assembly protein I
VSVPPNDRRPTMAVAMEWVSRITSVALMMTLPAGAGYWGDQHLGSAPWLLVLGAAVGLVMGMMQLLRMTAPARRGASRRSRQGDV